MPAALTIGVMATAVLIAVRMLWARRDVLYALVVVWAFVGIYLKRSVAVEDGSGLVASAALAGLAVLGMGVLFTASNKLKNAAVRAS